MACSTHKIWIKEFKFTTFNWKLEINMLILTRRVGETLIIGDDVRITLLGVKGNQIRVGIDAPKEVSVHREEIYDRIQRDKKTQEEEGE